MSPIHGIFLKAKEEIFRFAEFFVPRERNIPREVALLISFPSERYGVATGRVAKNDIATFASALEFSHYPIDVILEEQLPENRASRYRMILAAGVSNTYPATVGKLREFVEAGGILLLTREFMQEDEYGNPNRAWGDLFSLEYRDAPEALPREIELDIPQAKLLPGRIVGRNVREILAAPGWEKLAASGPHPVLLRRPLGKGFLYLLTATMQDYAAAAIVGADEVSLKSDLQYLGFLFESLVEHDLRVYIEHLGGRLSHYQDYENCEVDAVLSLPDGNYGLVEIKLGAHHTILNEAAGNLLRVSRKLEKEASFLAIISGLAPIPMKRKDGVYVIPLTSLKP